jgi:cell division protein FtsW (lipid II flippase)
MRFAGILLVAVILSCIGMIVISSKKLKELKDDSNTEQVYKFKSTYIVTIVGSVLTLIVCSIIAFILGSELFY